MCSGKQQVIDKFAKYCYPVRKGKLSIGLWVIVRKQKLK